MSGASWLEISPDLKTLLFSRKEGLFVKPVEGGAERLVARVEWGEDLSLSTGTRRERESHSIEWWTVRHPLGSACRRNRHAAAAAGFQGEQGPRNGRPTAGGCTSFRNPKTGGDLYLQGSRGWLGWMRRPAPVRLTSGPTRFGIP